MTNGKLTYPDIALLRAAAPKGLRIYARGWAASFAGPFYPRGCVTTLLRAGYLASEPDETGARVIVTRTGRDVIGRSTQAQAAHIDFETAFASEMRIAR